ncbi:histone deacetylase family protein [Trichuris suis]|nr:histone deacetylase family protein [Trichuris suis]
MKSTMIASEAKERSVIVPGYATQREMESHECLWYDDHVESPDRLKETVRHCEELGLLSRMKRLQIVPCSEEVLTLFHSAKYVRRIARTEKMERNKLEELCDKYDSVYLCRKSYECALLATGAVVEAAKAVVEGKCAGCIALVRPPGHHAMKREANGFCIFNNVGVAASYALKHLGLKRILIVDWDVHYGQGVQKAFYKRSDVLCISIHRHQQGTFWPFMEEAEWDRIGSSDGEGFNVNIPLNQVNLSDIDYLAIFRHIVVPIAVEYKPELVFVSAGFDAAVGCPEGNMKLSPQAFGHLTNMLMPIAGNRLVIALEGGYCIESLSWSVSCVIRALLRDPLFALNDVNVAVTPSVVNMIHLTALALEKHWKCMQAFLRTISSCLAKTGSEPYYALAPDFLGKCHMTEEDITKRGSLSNATELKAVIRDLESATLKWREQPMPRVHFHIINESSDMSLPASTFSDLSINHRLRSYIYCTLADLNQSDEVTHTPTKRTRLQVYTSLMYTTGQIVYSMMQRQMLSGVIAGDLPYGYIVNTLTNLVSSTFGKHNVKRPLIVSSRGNVMFFKQTHSDGSTCLWLNTAFIPLYEATKLDESHESKEPLDDDTFCVKVDLPASRPNGVDRLFVLQQLLLPIAYAHCPDLVVMELDFYESSFLGIEPSLYSFMVSNLMALASGRLLIIATAKGATNNVEQYLLSVLAPLAGSNPHFEDTLGNGSVSNECISMIANAISQLQHFYPLLKSVFVPSKETVNMVETMPSKSNCSEGSSADNCPSSAAQVLSKRKSVLSKDKSPQSTTTSFDDSNSNRIVDNATDHKCSKVSRSVVCARIGPIGHRKKRFRLSELRHALKFATASIFAY